MKSNRIGTPPQERKDLGNGSSQVNFNVTEEENEEGVMVYTYDQITVTNPVTQFKIDRAMEEWEALNEAES